VELEAARNERCTTESGLILLTSLATSITTSYQTPDTIRPYAQGGRNRAITLVLRNLERTLRIFRPPCCLIKLLSGALQILKGRRSRATGSIFDKSPDQVPNCRALLSGSVARQRRAASAGLRSMAVFSLLGRLSGTPARLPRCRPPVRLGSRNGARSEKSIRRSRRTAESVSTKACRPGASTFQRRRDVIPGIGLPRQLARRALPWASRGSSRRRKLCTQPRAPLGTGSSMRSSTVLQWAPGDDRARVLSRRRAQRNRQ
jgi:hypothetical protein